MTRNRCVYLSLVPFIVMAAVSATEISRSLPHGDGRLGINLTFMKGPRMQRNKDPSRGDYLFPHADKHSNSLEPDEEELRLEEELRHRGLIHDAHVQWLMEKATRASAHNRKWARDQIRLILEGDRITDMRTGDPFRPLGPAHLLAAGDLHLLNQIDGAPWKIPRTALPRGLLVTGSQGSGKTRFLIWLCKQLNGADPPIRWFLIDPKLEFRYWADALDAVYVDADDPATSFDLSPPPNLTYETWLPSLVPQLGEIVGVIYGTEILQQATEICIELRRRYISQSNRTTEICLLDVHNALPFVEGASNWRRAGYKDAAITGLSRIITGSGNLFKCRKGIDLTGLFQRNVILGTRSITDDFATRFLAFYLLWYLQESERRSEPTQQPKSVLIIDDAARYIGAREGSTGRSLSSIGSILTTMRSSGRCFVAVSQVPHLIDAGVSALMHTVVNVGGLHHAADTQLLAKMMGLSEPQRLALMSLAQREAIALCGGSAWPHVIHGQVPDVPDASNRVQTRHADVPELQTQPFESLFELIRSSKPVAGHPSDDVRRGEIPAPKTLDAAVPQKGLDTPEQILALDVVTFLTSTLRERLERLGFSGRQLEDTKQGLVNKGLVKEVWLGKNLMLAPCQSLYELLNLSSPYRRNAWDIHSYLVLLAAKLIEPNPLVKSVKTEVSLGDSSSTVDVVAYLKDANRIAYEVIHKGVTNISATAAKLQGKGFSTVCLVCLDFNIKERAHATIRNAGFAPDFLATIRYRIFSSLLREKKQVQP